jgi:glycine/D-amino acid oxidase-like deaminating enzyme
VVVVGGGITGLSAAYLLAKAGQRVILLERGRCAATDTGHTSAHLTMVTDARLSELVKGLGRPHAQAVWDAGLAAIATIDDIVREHAIEASFEWVDGYLHAPLGDDASDQAEQLKADAKLAGELDFDAEYLESVPLMGRPGVRFADQARIHPRQYLAGLAKAFVALAGRIHEHSEADEFCEDPRRVKANGQTVTCEDVVIATHNPLVGFGGMAGATLFQTKLALYTSYVIAGRVARGVVPDALWWDTADPYQFLRVETLASRAFAAGCVFALDSDAHTTTQRSYAETALAHARLVGIPVERIVNCWPLDRLLAWLSNPSSERRP